MQGQTECARFKHMPRSCRSPLVQENRSIYDQVVCVHFILALSVAHATVLLWQIQFSCRGMSDKLQDDSPGTDNYAITLEHA